MYYEEQIRERMYKAPHGSTEKELLKVLLGEVQQKSNLGPFTDEMGLAIVKKMMKANEETIPHLSETDPRRAKLLGENKVLTSLLPQKWLERHPEVKHRTRDMQIIRGTKTLKFGIKTDVISASIIAADDIEGYDPVEDQILYMYYLADDDFYDE